MKLTLKALRVNAGFTIKKASKEPYYFLCNILLAHLYN